MREEPSYIIDNGLQWLDQFAFFTIVNELEEVWIFFHEFVPAPLAAVRVGKPVKGVIER